MTYYYSCVCMTYYYYCVFLKILNREHCIFDADARLPFSAAPHHRWLWWQVVLVAPPGGASWQVFKQKPCCCWCTVPQIHSPSPSQMAFPLLPAAWTSDGPTHVIDPLDVLRRSPITTDSGPGTWFWHTTDQGPSKQLRNSSTPRSSFVAHSLWHIHLPYYRQHVLMQSVPIEVHWWHLSHFLTLSPQES